jgi:hypothetical protein
MSPPRTYCGVPKKQRTASAAAARLTVLAAAGDTDALWRHAVELLSAPERLGREAALDALLTQPVPAARPALRALYDELAADGLKRDQGATMRVAILRILRAIGDARDADLATRASTTHESAFGEDIAWSLRAHGLMLLADLAPDAFAYYAVEHLDDRTGDGEPANTAFQLLAALENYLPIYQWLLRAEAADPLIGPVFELFAEGPRPIVERYANHALGRAGGADGEALAIVIAEAVIRLELDAAYPALGALIARKLSDELYNYLAVLLASTNRPPLLAILEHELHRGRRPKLIEAALRVRPTPEQDAILRRWEE